MKDQNNWIYFLCLNSTPPKSYYRLAAEFKNQGRMLVPVTFDQLKITFGQTAIDDLIIVVRTLDDLKRFNMKVKRYLFFLIKARKLNFHFISSFEVKAFTQNFSRINFNKYTLPLTFHSLAQEISSVIKKRVESKNTWPGGRRGSYRLS